MVSYRGTKDRAEGLHISHTERRVGEEQKMYPEEDFRRCRNNPGCGKSVKIRKREVVPAFAGRTRTHRLDLELLFWAALMWSCRWYLPSAPHSQTFSYCICALKNTSLDTHKPSIRFPDPTEMHIFALKPCFSTALERIAVFARFLSSIHEGGEDDR